MTSHPMKIYETFAEWKKDQTAKNKKLITAIEVLVKSIEPALTTTVKWGQGCFVEGRAHKLYIHAAPEYVQFGFYQGSTMDDPHKLLKGKGRFVRYIEVFSVKDIDEAAFSKLIEQAVR